MKIGIIGTGNMGGALMDAFRLDPQNTMRACNHGQEKLAAVCSRTGAEPVSSVREAAEGADLILLAVKPIVIPSVLEELALVLQPEQIVVSIAVGLSMLPVPMIPIFIGYPSNTPLAAMRSKARRISSSVRTTLVI